MITLLYLSLLAIVCMFHFDLPLWLEIIVTIVWFVSSMLTNARWDNMCDRVEILENIDRINVEEEDEENN